MRRQRRAVFRIARCVSVAFDFELRMRFLLLTIVLLEGLMMCACCTKGKDRIEPSYPKVVAGWEVRKELHYFVLGEFVLKKGETTDNGKLQIKLIDLIEGECIDAPFSQQRRFVVQFSKLPSGEIICEDEYIETGSANRKGDCKEKLDEFGIRDVRGKEVNIKDS